MKRNLLDILTVIGLLIVPGLANAQDTNAAAAAVPAAAVPMATTPAPVVAATNAPRAAAAPTTAQPAAADDDVNPVLKALAAKAAAAGPAPKAVAPAAAAADEVNPALKAAAAKAGPLTDSTSLVTRVSLRNIFDPRRVPPTIRQPYVAPTPIVRSDWFSLQGTSRNDDVWSAFFDGASPQYRKTAQVGDTIAGYKIADIAVDYIMLSAASNKTVKLPMQAQMRKTGTGPWSLGGRSGSSGYNGDVGATASAAPSEGAPDASASPSLDEGGSASDALKRLMAKRLKDE